MWTAIARFCLGRYWRQATAEQKRRYVGLFHQVLVTSITSKLGEYQGVTFAVGRAVPDGDNEKVATVVHRPNNPPTNVQWLIKNPATSPEDHRRGRRGHVAASDPAQRLRVLPGAQRQQHRRTDQRDAPADRAEPGGIAAGRESAPRVMAGHCPDPYPQVRIGQWPSVEHTASWRAKAHHPRRCMFRQQPGRDRVGPVALDPGTPVRRALGRASFRTRLAH